MWKHWKNKIKNFFRQKTDKHDVDNEHDSEQLHAKVTYHYPGNTTFRFPVVPDEPHNGKDMEEPAYKRRKSEHRNTIPKAEDAHYINTSRRLSNNIAVSEDKDTDIPFRPSKVPSPIYGYQERKTNERISNVPTFVRKQEIDNANREEEIHVSPETAKDEKEQTQFHPDSSAGENDRQKQYHHDNDSAEQTVKVADSEAKGNGKESHDGMKKGAGISLNETTAPDSKENKSTYSNTDQQPKRRSKRGKQSKKQKPVPFNVMMSHNDKLRYHQNEQQSVTKERPSVNINDDGHIPFHLLNDKAEHTSQDRLWVRDQQELLEKTLAYFNVQASVVNATQGPSVTRFEVQPALGVKVSKVKNLSDDIKLNLAAEDIRMEAPIPGKNTIGIEIPNQKPQVVGLQDIFSTKAFKENTSPLTIGLGLTIEGNPSITNIQKMPHGLIAGATGSGKSVCINTILISLLYKADHKSVKFLLIDPKMVELAPYNGIPNLISPVITDVKAATKALKWAVDEMEDRYDRFVQEGARDVERYNAKMVEQNRQDEKMPYIVIVIDELADLMMVSPQDVEDAISRIAQKARASGIHLLLATQRPSVDVITGLIKANIPTRIAFSVSSQVDSRTIIDTNGAEKLLGKGDMLFVENGAGKSIRLQGAFVSDDEIDRVTDYARSIATPEYVFEQDQLLEQVDTDENEDELLETAIQFVVEENNASTSLLQRRFKIGYNRAARLMDAMEQKGIISEQNGTKPRSILITSASL